MTADLLSGSVYKSYTLQHCLKLPSFCRYPSQHFFQYTGGEMLHFATTFHGIISNTYSSSSTLLFYSRFQHLQSLVSSMNIRLKCIQVQSGVLSMLGTRENSHLTHTVPALGVFNGSVQGEFYTISSLCSPVMAVIDRSLYREFYSVPNPYFLGVFDGTM